MAKTVFITGASSGFGSACAKVFAEKGWQLILTARRQDRLESLARELSVPTYTASLDVRDAEAVRVAVETLPDRFKNVDVLVNNAGLALGRDLAPKASLEDWDTMVDTNVKGVMYCTRHLLPLMVERNQGHIVNIGSIAASFPYAGGNAYGATKAFVQQFSKNLKADLLGTQLRVTNIEPGHAETEFSVVRFKGDQEKAASVYTHMQPLKAQDIAESVYWVVSQPTHVNITHIEMMATHQAWGNIHRDA